MCVSKITVKMISLYIMFIDLKVFVDSANDVLLYVDIYIFFLIGVMF